MDMGHVRARWLYAAATDRKLIREGKKQKYGTQFQISKNGIATPYPYAKSTTDVERSKFLVPPISVRKNQIESFWRTRKN